MTLISERWLDEVVLSGAISNIDGDQDNEFVPPSGLPDLALMELLYFVLNVATKATITEFAARTMIVNAAGSAVDIAGVDKFRSLGAARFGFYCSPDPLVLMRQGERLQIIHDELDTNATAAADVILYAKFVRVRNEERQPTGPIQLVR